jgi:predicted dehydrogenase
MSKGRGLKVGIIGAGKMGTFHARACNSLPGINLFAVADPVPEVLRQIETQFGIQTFADYKEMFPQVEALILASPSETHFEIAKECLTANKNLLIEKPICQNSNDAAALVELTKDKAQKTAVGMIERFNPAFDELRKLLKKEKIVGVHIKRFSPFPARITDANVIQDMMIHDLDLLLNLVPKEEIESIKATGEKIKTEKLDKVFSTIYFKSGLIAKVDADRVFGVKTRKITVTTERVLLEADLLKKEVLVRDLITHVPSVHATKKADQLILELTDFFKAIKKNQAPRVSFADAHRSLKLAEEVERACS